MVLRGHHKGQYKYKDASVGVGGVDVSVTYEGTDLYYSGRASDITPNTFYGQRTELNFGVNIGISLGMNAVFSNVGKDFVIGIGPSIGLGLSPFIISGNINKGGSQERW